MSNIWRKTCRAPSNRSRRASTCTDPIFAQGDQVVLRRKRGRSPNSVYVHSLNPGQVVKPFGSSIIRHENIIGKSPRDTVLARASDKKDIEYRVFSMSLEDYVLKCRRIVTPIYPSDSAVIVNLLDLHPDRNTPKLEILEAGTGNGGLTLYLSRAIHAANPPKPSLAGKDEAEIDFALTEWKSERNAVIHSIERSPEHMKQAQNNVAEFRNGMYFHNVEFHTGDVGAWLSDRVEKDKGKPSLSHIVLDIPDAQYQLATAADALNTDGTLILFFPHITQIVACAAEIRKHRLLLDLDRVLELPTNGANGGRQWDVRFSKPRDRNRPQAEPETDEEGVEESASEVEDDGKLHTTCRPKVGVRTTGGGFLGVWKKMRNTNPSEVDKEKEKEVRNA